MITVNTVDASITCEQIADDYQGGDPSHVYRAGHRHRASSARLTAVECMISGCKSKWSKQIELRPKQSRLAESNQRAGKKRSPTSSALVTAICTTLVRLAAICTTGETESYLHHTGEKEGCWYGIFEQLNHWRSYHSETRCRSWRIGCLSLSLLPQFMVWPGQITCGIVRQQLGWGSYLCVEWDGYLVEDEMIHGGGRWIPGRMR